jgi:hypothetical protein
MFDRYKTQGAIDALRRFGFTKEANQMPLPGMGPSAATGPAAGAGALGGMWDKAKTFGHGQWGAAKELAGNLHQGLGGAPHAAAGQAARGAAVGNLKTLAPSLLAGGALFMAHRHNKAKEEAAAQQRAMMMQGGGGGYPTM